MTPNDMALRAAISIYLLVPGLHAQEVETIKSQIAEYADVATKTHMNEAYKPYIITTIDTKEMQLLGVATLEEALTIVAGLDVHMDELNSRDMIIRGSNSNAYGQTQLFIDGVLVNNVIYDGYSEYMRMPIELIKRIEVVRGNGAEISVFNPFSGMIRVVTYAESFAGVCADGSKGTLFGRYTTMPSGVAGGRAQYREGKLFYNLDAYYYNDDETTLSGPDAASTGRFNFPSLGIDNTGVSQEGTVQLGKAEYGVGAKLQYGGFYILGRLQGYESDVAYGQIYLLPEESYDNQIKQPNHHVELGYHVNFESWKIAANLGYRYNSLYIKSLAAPAGFTFPSTDTPPAAVTFPDGYESEFTTVQQQTYQSTTVSYSGLENHRLSVGYRVNYEKTTDVEAFGTDRSTGVGIADQTGTTPPIIPGSNRLNLAGVVGDEISLLDKLSMNVAVNAEKNTQYDKVILDPKVSLVYRLTNNDIFKLIYTKSHRNPSWQELYSAAPGSKVGNPNLDPETVSMFEAAYVKRIGQKSAFQANIFFLRYKNQISNENPENLYFNAFNSEIRGVELEAHTDVGDYGRVYTSYSFASGEIDDGASLGVSLSQMANHMVKGYYLHTLSTELTGGVIMKYVGSKQRNTIDTRDPLSPYTTFDVSLNYKEPVYGIVANIAIKNALDEIYALPSNPYTYDDDYRQQGRYFSFTLRKDFD